MDKLSKHEALHTAHICGDMIAEHLEDHPYITSHPCIKGYIDLAISALNNAYQQIENEPEKELTGKELTLMITDEYCEFETEALKSEIITLKKNLEWKKILMGALITRCEAQTKTIILKRNIIEGHIIENTALKGNLDNSNKWNKELEEKNEKLKALLKSTTPYLKSWAAKFEREVGVTPDQCWKIIKDIEKA